MAVGEESRLEFAAVKPIAIVRHAAADGPGYFAAWLEQRGLASELLALDQGARVPRDASRFAGLVLMGGPMSVNDPLPWIEPLLALIRDAVAKDVPLLGHCLGGQLMSKAFGGTVARTPVKEIGWAEVQVQDNDVARSWFGDATALPAFHWHGETFTIPPGATRVLSSAFCENQGFAIGRHLGLQCHIEMDQALVGRWCEEGAGEIAECASSPGVQPVEEIRRDLDARVARLHVAADGVYARWAKALGRG